jgi:hypothetical protein
MAGYSGTPLPRKLGIREGARVATLHAPDHLDEILVPWPTGAIVEPLDRAAVPGGEDARFDVILLFVKDEGALKQGLEAAPDHLKVAGGLWIGWPKMTSPLFDGLKESHVRDAGLRTGLVDNKICAIDADWSGLRFVFRKEDRPEITERRNAPEGDR